MKRLTLLIFCVLWAYSANGQTDTVIVNVVALEIATDALGYLKFNPETSNVTEGWIGFADEVGRYYKEKLLKAKRHVIQLTPMLTRSEKELANQLVPGRTGFIISYLKTKFQIDKENIRVAGTLYDEDVGAVQIRILHREINELTRKQRRQIKRESQRQNFDNDTYFTEQRL